MLAIVFPTTFRTVAALGQTSCWPLGDVIIALQALPAAQIWTIDADFQPIVQALGLALYVPLAKEESHLA